MDSPLGADGEQLSIIIPTYNCAAYLRETLRSVKAELADRFSGAQICVLDDHSTADDPGAIVTEIWPQRVRFIQHPQNVGPCANFNACVELANREWIHILHGDDYVLPGVYTEFARCIEEHPDAIAVFARAMKVTAEGKQMGEVSPSLGPAARGWLKYEPLAWSHNPILFPSVLISRTAVNLIGNFDCTFCHVQDWNLWWRIAMTKRAVYSNAVVAAYREFEGNHTSTIVRNGTSLRESLDQLDRLVESVRNDATLEQIPTEAFYQKWFQIGLAVLSRFFDEPESFAANYRLFQRFPAKFRRHPKLLWMRLRYLENNIRRRLSLPMRPSAAVRRARQAIGTG
jgi:glycosyltransferase involved in cell wall biosynthesis